MAVAEYVTKADLMDALKPISAEMRTMEERLESRIYTVKGEIIGRMDCKLESMEKRILETINSKLEAFEGHILAEIRNGR